MVLLWRIPVRTWEGGERIQDQIKGCVLKNTFAFYGIFQETACRSNGIAAWRHHVPWVSC